MLPILLGFGIYQMLKDAFPKKERIERGIVVGEELEKAKKDSIALQGLYYREPQSLYNSSNLYMPISTLTYTEGKILNGFVSSANDFDSSFFKFANIIFLDDNYQLINSLLEVKASILEINPQDKSTPYEDKSIDKSAKYIGYLIGFEDSNNDGKLNSLDFHDLYISDFYGKNLTKVTNGLDVVSFDFIKSNTQIFIKYKRRENIREEHKRELFTIYDIYKSKYLDLSSLNKELDRLEKIIIQ